MTLEELKAHDFELSFDPSEIGGGTFTYFSLGKDEGGGIADILIRWEQRGFGITVDGACEKAEALAKEVVTRWNGYPSALALIEHMAVTIALCKAALNSDVMQPIKASSEVWESMGVKTDTVYHLNGAVCGDANDKARQTLAAYKAFKKGGVE